MEYKYKGIELTPAIFRELLIEMFDGKQFDRTTAINAIVQYHNDNGGVLNHSSYVPTFKKACQTLKDNGIENIGYGTWRLAYEMTETVEIVAPKAQDEVAFSADKYLGDGDCAVYVYYYDKYKEYAELKENVFWECKIGRTDVDPINRIFSQAGTCYPEYPHLALIIYCKDSSLLERAFHSILKLKGRWIEQSPGKEWFITSPEEIEEIYKTII